MVLQSSQVSCARQNGRDTRNIDPEHRFPFIMGASLLQQCDIRRFNKGRQGVLNRLEEQIPS
jgi:hypothetical protein